MKIDIQVPAMGESISEATIGQILKATGSKVEADDEILELETEKVNQVIYAPQAGVVAWNIKTGDVVKVGQKIGEIDSAGVTSSQKEPEKISPKAAEAPKEAPKASVKQETATAPNGGARISRDAYLKELSEPKSEPAPKQEEETKSAAAPLPQKTFTTGDRRETRTKLTKIRQVIAKRLVEAQHTTAMLTTFNEADMSQVMQLREKYKDIFIKEHGVKLGFMSFFVKSVVHALQEIPGVNSYIEGDELVHREYYDIGVAVGTDKGLFVPVVRNCDKLSFAEIESSIESYAKKAREGTLSMDDLQGGGFTITNGGVYGSLLSTPILNPPQAGILGMHKILKRPVVVDDEIVIRPMMYLALSYDHRVIDGKEAVTFLVKVKECLEDPARFVLGV